MKQALVENLADTPAVPVDSMADIAKTWNLEWHEIPSELQNDKEFCRIIIEPIPSKKFWKKMSTRLDSRYRLGTPCQYFDNGIWVNRTRAVFDKHLELLEDPDVWKKYLKFRGCGPDLRELCGAGYFVTNDTGLARALFASLMHYSLQLMTTV